MGNKVSLIMKLCSFSQYKIHPGKGTTLVKADGKTFIFHTSKVRRAHLMKRAPREVKWTILYRRKHRKGVEEESTKKRSRKTQKTQRAIGGMSLTEILAKRNMKPEVRKAQREQAIRALKEKTAAVEAGKKHPKGKADKKNQKPIPKVAKQGKGSMAKTGTRR